MDYIRRLFFGALKRPSALSSTTVSSTTASSPAVFSSVASSTTVSPAASSTTISSPILNKLSLDILLHIMGFLSPASAIAFSLSCKHLQNLLGTQHFSRVATSAKETLVLLEFLARDLPNQIACSPCKRLHDMINLQRYSWATYSMGSQTNQYDSLRRPACVSQDWHNNICKITKLFGTTAFKMAVKRYQAQPECTELVEMMSSTTPQTFEMGNYIGYFKEDCQIIQGSLMHRLQGVYISRKSSTTNDEPFRFDPPSAMICPHVNFGRSVYNCEYGLRNCQECRTEYRIDLRHYPEHGFAMFFTRWKDLGAGPDSGELKHHIPRCVVAFIRASFLPKADVQESEGLGSQVVVLHQAGDLASAFGDDGENFNFESLLAPGDMNTLLSFQKQH